MATTATVSTVGILSGSRQNDRNKGYSNEAEFNYCIHGLNVIFYVTAGNKPRAASIPAIQTSRAKTRIGGRDASANSELPPVRPYNSDLLIRSLQLPPPTRPLESN